MQNTKIKMCVGVAALVILTSIPLPTYYISTASAPNKTLQDYSVVEMIEYYSALYNQNPDLLKKVAECESKFDTDILGDGGRAFSVYQFHRGTFESWSKKKGEVLDYNSYHDNIKLAVWSFAQGESYRKHWTSYVAIKNGGTYSFYSKLLKRHFSIYCAL